MKPPTHQDLIRAHHELAAETSLTEALKNASGPDYDKVKDISVAEFIRFTATSGIRFIRWDQPGVKTSEPTGFTTAEVNRAMRSDEQPPIVSPGALEYRVKEVEAANRELNKAIDACHTRILKQDAEIAAYRRTGNLKHWAEEALDQCAEAMGVGAEKGFDRSELPGRIRNLYTKVQQMEISIKIVREKRDNALATQKEALDRFAEALGWHKGTDPDTLVKTAKNAREYSAKYLGWVGYLEKIREALEIEEGAPLNTWAAQASKWVAWARTCQEELEKSTISLAEFDKGVQAEKAVASIRKHYGLTDTSSAAEVADIVGVNIHNFKRHRDALTAIQKVMWLPSNTPLEKLPEYVERFVKGHEKDSKRNQELVMLLARCKDLLGMGSLEILDLVPDVLLKLVEVSDARKEALDRLIAAALAAAGTGHREPKVEHLVEVAYMSRGVR